MDYITAQTPDKGVQIGPEPPISNGSMALTPDKGVQIGPELLITNANTALTPDKGVQIGPEPSINNYNMAMEPDKGVQVGPELPISNDSIAMASDNIPGFAGNLIEAGIVLNGTKSAVYKSAAYPASADGTQRPGAVVEYSSEFSVGEGFSMGGVKSELPAGYIAADFIETRGVCMTGVPLQTDVGVQMHVEPLTFNNAYLSGAYNKDDQRLYGLFFNNSSKQCLWSYGLQYVDNSAFYAAGQVNFSLNFMNDGLALISSGGENYSQPLTNKFTLENGMEISINARNFKGVGNVGNTLQRYFYFKLSIGADIVRDFTPCVTNQGNIVFYDKANGLPYSFSGTLTIVGFTLTQALQLRKLPATGGTLTISLPTGYDSDASVMAALETARSKGWTLTIQTYTPETATDTASTFALRRIWVRKTQDDNGAYIDTDGSRWQVDWCVDMITPDGSTPDAYGYEMFRNIDAAVAYWELTPYIDPEAEKEFSQEL